MKRIVFLLASAFCFLCPSMAAAQYAPCSLNVPLVGITPGSSGANPQCWQVGPLTSIANVSPGTGVNTALATNINSPGAFVVNGGQLGSPSSVGTMPSFTESGTITGGGHVAITSLGVRDTSAAFDVTIAAASSTALTAGRILTINMVNAARTLNLGANLTLATDPGAVTGALKSNGSGTFSQASCADLTVACLTGNQTITLSGGVSGSGTTTITATLDTAQPAVHTWALAQTFTVAPVFTDQSGSRTALGLGTMATQNASAISVTGGTLAGLTGLAMRDTSAAFDVTLAATSSTTLTAGRALTFDVGNVAHTLKFGTTPNTITFPNLSSFTVITNGDTGTVTNAMLANSSVTYGTTAVALGASSTSIAGLTSLGLTTGSTINWNSDTYIGRGAAANIKLGQADAASPVAQTISVQNVVAGTSNTAGVDLTINGSQGTGTGAGGGIRLQVAPAGTTGTAQNALTAAGVNIFPNGTGVNTATVTSARFTVEDGANNQVAFRYPGKTGFLGNQASNGNFTWGLADNAQLAIYTNNGSGGYFALFPGGGMGIGATVTGRSQADTIEVAGNIYAQKAYVAAGTVPIGTTGSCVASSFTGGATAGKFSAAVCAGGTIILSSLPAAPTGYTCSAYDQTTSADTLKQTAYTTTSVTFAATTVASDVVVFKCMAW